MKSKFIGFFVCFLILFFFVSCASKTKDQNTKNKFVFVASTSEVMNYKKSDIKSDRMYDCTALAFFRDGQKYLFVTVAHCVEYDDQVVNGLRELPFVWLEKENGEVSMPYQARIVGIGKDKGENFVFLEANIPEDIPLVPWQDY